MADDDDFTDFDEPVLVFDINQHENDKVLSYLFLEDAMFLEPPDAPAPRKMGRPALHEQFPNVVPVVDAFIMAHGVAAHDRRQDTVQHSVGVTLRQIRAYILQEMPEVAVAYPKLSLETVHKLLRAPRLNSGAAWRYKALVNAKVAYSKNDIISKPHVDIHFAAAQVNYVMEMCQLFSEEVICMSCDDKHKLTCGLPAVDRRNDFNKICPADSELEEERPHFADHDYPLGPKRKLTPAGYKLLEEKYHNRRSRSVERRRPNRVKQLRRTRPSSIESYRPPGTFSQQDNKGRCHVPYSKSGPLHVFLKADQLTPSTSQLHINHLNQLLAPYLELNPTKRNLVAIVDGGPDYNGKSHLNMLNFGRLWHLLDLDVFILTSYAPGASKFNPIERSWAILNRSVVGAIVPDGIPVVTRQGTIEERKLGDCSGLFDNLIYCHAVRKMSKYWNGRKHDNFLITGHAEEDNPGPYFDHSEVQESFKGPKAYRNLSDVQKSAWAEMPFLMSHCVRKKYCLMFMKCGKTDCSCHSNRPESDFVSFLRSMGGMVPDPKFSEVYRNVKTGVFSYDSFYQRCSDVLTNPIVSFPDANLPSNIVDSADTACKYGCAMYFYSQADTVRHEKVVHRFE